MRRIAKTAILGLFAGALTVSLGLVSGPANAVTTWSSPILVTDSSQNTQDPVLAVSRDGITQIVVFRKEVGGMYRIHFTRSTDTGKTWSEPVVVSPGGANAGAPTVAVSSDGSVAMIVWRSSGGGIENIKGAVLHADTGTITGPFDISSDSAESLEVGMAMSHDGRRATVVWLGNNPNTNNYYVDASSTTDGGENWGPVHTFGASPRERTEPKIAASSDGRSLIATWTEQSGGGIFDVTMSQSTDAGASWSAPQAMFAQPEDQTEPFVTSSDNGEILHVAYVQSLGGGTQSIPYIVSSSDGGATWGAPTPTNVLETTNSLRGLVASSNGKHLAVLALSDPTAARIAYVDSTDDSSNWTTLTLPSLMEFGAEYFGGSYAADGSVLATTWTTYAASSSTISIATSTDHGANWGTTKTFTENDRQLMFPRVAPNADGTIIASSWRQFTSPTTNKLFAAEFGTAGPVAFSPSNASFGNVALGSTGSMELTVTNTSAPNAKIAGFSATGRNVSVSGDTCAIGGTVSFQESCTVKVQWEPTVLGALTDSTVTLTWDGVPDAVATLSGNAVRAKQTLSTTETFPKVIHAGRPSVLVKRTLGTNAIQAVTPRVRCVPPRLLATGDVAACTVRISKTGRVTVNAPTPGTRVTLTLRAPGTKMYRPFFKVLHWKVKK